MTAILSQVLSADFPIRVLAVIGAIAIGAFFLAGLVQIATKAFFNQRVPRWPLWGMRILGGVACGWFVGLWLFGGGGGGIGGPGGLGMGGDGDGDGQKQPVVVKLDKDKADKDRDSADKKPVPESETIRVEILGDAPLKKLAGSSTFDPGKRYRLAGQTELLSLDELQQQIRQRRQGSEALQRLEIILYLDSPDRQLPQVSLLVRWANDLVEQGKKPLRVDFTEKDRHAPVD